MKHCPNCNSSKFKPRFDRPGQTDCLNCGFIHRSMEYYERVKKDKQVMLQ